MKDHKEHYNDFTEDHYLEILTCAKKKYNFIKYHHSIEQTNIAIWRHDLDGSIHRAIKLAQLENELDIKATYFIHPHCNFYHWNDKENFDLLQGIKDLGHELALHFDPSFYGKKISNLSMLEKWLSIEKKMLEDFLNIEVKVFSFHNPTIGNWLNHSQNQLAGMLNAYGEKFKNFKYCSDSNGYWRHDRILDIIQSDEHSKVHILTHPRWWVKSPMQPRERIVRSAFGRAHSTLSTYDKDIISFKRNNIRGISDYYKFLFDEDKENYFLLDYLFNNGNHKIAQDIILNLFKTYAKDILKKILEQSSTNSLKLLSKIKLINDPKTLKLCLNEVFSSHKNFTDLTISSNTHHTPAENSHNILKVFHLTHSLLTEEIQEHQTFDIKRISDLLK